MHMTKFIGKPYAGKPHVRIDEGAGKVFLSFPLYSTDNLAHLAVNKDFLDIHQRMQSTNIILTGLSVILTWLLHEFSHWTMGEVIFSSITSFGGLIF